jgi:hypothetical protein
MTTQFYRTGNMEKTALLLDQRHDRVMVRAACALSAPIRFRWKMLTSIRPFLLRNDPAFDSEIAKWQKQNGTLINNRKYLRGEPVLKHNACVICECPMSWDEVEQMARDAADVCVIYRPPSWRNHEGYLHAAWPSGMACKRFAEAMPEPLTAPNPVTSACGIPVAGTRQITDDDLLRSLGINDGELHCLRKRTMRVVDSRKKYSHRFSLVQRLIPRIEPEDITLLPMYRAITELPCVGHIRLARDNALAGAGRFWKTTLRALIRSGCVERKETLGYYFFDGPAPDYERIQAEHVAARSKFDRVTKQVDALGEYK